jgi:hypothetical protein
MAGRRYVFKFVTRGSPAWSGKVWAIGCKHLASAEALFDRRRHEVEPGDALLLIDREAQAVLRAEGTPEPEKVANWYGW